MPHKQENSINTLPSIVSSPYLGVNGSVTGEENQQVPTEMAEMPQDVHDTEQGEQMQAYQHTEELADESSENETREQVSDQRVE